VSPKHHQFWLVVVIVFALLAGNVSPGITLDEVKVHTSGSTSANVLIYKIAQEKGFYGRKISTC
jgi:hypothetical protein